MSQDPERDLAEFCSQSLTRLHKVSTSTWSHLGKVSSEGLLGKDLLLSSLRLLAEFSSLRASVFCWLSAGSHSQLLEAMTVPCHVLACVFS